MRKIEKAMIGAIINHSGFSQGNTMVRVHNGAAHIYLHHNRIARYTYCTQRLHLTNAGYATRTTQSRLNALLAGLRPNTGFVRTQGGRQYYFGSPPIELYDGVWVDVDAPAA